MILGAVAVLLTLALLSPLWTTRMEAPQYRGEEALRVQVYAGRISGDVEEIETLNQYVGVRLPLDTPELEASPWVIGVLLLLALAGVLSRPRARRAVAGVLLVSMCLAVAAAGASLQYRLYRMGHVRGDSILEGVPDFTPPLLGTAKIANFTVHMSLGLGGWAYLAALVLAGWTVFAGRRRHAELTGDTHEPSPDGRSTENRGENLMAPSVAVTGDPLNRGIVEGRE